MGFLFLIIFIAAVFFLVFYIRSKNVKGGMPETPIDILKKRYARGELSKEDFDRLKRDLQ